MTDLITIDNVTKKYGDKTALANANIAIEKGDFVVLVGMSGSGKTTLLRMWSQGSNNQAKEPSAKMVF